MASRSKPKLNLNGTEFGLLVATPILTGSLVRLPLGILTGRYGGRIIFFIQMLLVAIPTWLLSYATEYWRLSGAGIVCRSGWRFIRGKAHRLHLQTWTETKSGNGRRWAFSVRATPDHRDPFIAPLIIASFGAWQMVPKVYAVALVDGAAVGCSPIPDPLHEKGADQNRIRPTLGRQLLPLLDTRLRRFGLSYAFVFGGFMALALWLPKYYVGEYGFTAGYRLFDHLLRFAVRRRFVRWAAGLPTSGAAIPSPGGCCGSACCVPIPAQLSPTTLIIHGIKGEVSLNLATGIITLFPDADLFN